MADDSQSQKLPRILPFLVPLVYAALLGFSVSPTIFPIDDQQEFRILRIKTDDESALWHLAMAYRAAGDEKRARRMEARALKTGGR